MVIRLSTLNLNASRRRRCFVCFSRDFWFSVIGLGQGDIFWSLKDSLHPPLPVVRAVTPSTWTTAPMQHVMIGGDRANANFTDDGADSIELAGTLSAPPSTVLAVTTPPHCEGQRRSVSLGAGEDVFTGKEAPSSTTPPLVRVLVTTLSTSKIPQNPAAASTLVKATTLLCQQYDVLRALLWNHCYGGAGADTSQGFFRWRDGYDCRYSALTRPTPSQSLCL